MSSKQAHHPRLPSLHSLPVIRTLFPHMSLSLRKDVMTLLRVGHTHSSNSRIRSRLSHMKAISIPEPSAYGTRVWNYGDLMSVIAPLLRTPTLRGLLSLLLRTIPLHDVQDARISLDQAVSKELQVTQSTTRQYSLSYPFLASYQIAASVPTHYKLPFRPFLQVAMHNRLISWRRNLTKHIYLPQCSYKSIGVISAENFIETTGVHFTVTKRIHISTGDLETFYMETGQETSGPCEVRAAWKYNDLKPRIYYAIGASAYFSSKHA
jgi:hypothetical protein